MKANLVKIFAFIFCCCILSSAIGQRQTSKSGAEKKINWLQPGKEFYSETVFVPYLRFEGAAYLENYMPVYSEKSNVGASTNSVSAELSDLKFVPLDEVHLIESFKDKIKTQIEISAKVSYERKVPFAVVSFLPLRKNPATGVYEKLISFNIKLTEASSGRGMDELPVYAASSVLSTGQWYKVGIPKNGIYKMNYSFLKSLGINVAGSDC